ncbi:MAG: molecular chaperone, partial [Sphingomonadaceae bacterium]
MAATAIVAMAQPAQAGVGDLLVAPTRVILDGGRGTQIILNNIGEEEATYRVTAELRR